MVTRSYLLHKPPPSGPLWRRLTQDVFPVVINGAGSAEVAVMRVRQETRRQPVVILVCALLAGSLLHGMLRRRA